MQIYSAPQTPRKFSLRVISTILDFIRHTEETNLVRHLKFRGNSEAIANEELTFSKYNNVKGLLQGRKHPSENIWEENKERYSRGSAE